MGDEDCIICCLMSLLFETVYSVLVTWGKAGAGHKQAAASFVSLKPCLHYYAVQVVVGTKTNSTVNYA